MILSSTLKVYLALGTPAKMTFTNNLFTGTFMENPLYYPPLDETTIKNLDLVRQLSKEHPSYWYQTEYPVAVERLVKSWFDPKTMKDLINEGKATADSEKITDKFDDDRNEYLYQETVILYQDMKLAKFAGSNEDSMSYFRAASTMLEKMLGFQERALGLKQVSDFYTIVGNILDNICTTEQRSQFIEQLQTAMGK